MKSHPEDLTCDLVGDTVFTLVCLWELLKHAASRWEVAMTD